jgi:hypothetical protein
MLLDIHYGILAHFKAFGRRSAGVEGDCTGADESCRRWVSAGGFYACGGLCCEC